MNLYCVQNETLCSVLLTGRVEVAARKDKDVADIFDRIQWVSPVQLVGRPSCLLLWKRGDIRFFIVLLYEIHIQPKASYILPSNLDNLAFVKYLNPLGFLKHDAISLDLWVPRYRFCQRKTLSNDELAIVALHGSLSPPLVVASPCMRHCRTTVGENIPFLWEQIDFDFTLQQCLVSDEKSTW